MKRWIKILLLTIKAAPGPWITALSISIVLVMGHYIAYFPGMSNLADAPYGIRAGISILLFLIIAAVLAGIGVAVWLTFDLISTALRQAIKEVPPEPKKDKPININKMFGWARKRWPKIQKQTHKDHLRFRGS